MRGVMGCVIATVLAIEAGFDGRQEAAAADAAPAYVLLFSGTDLWRHGAFLHGGLLWAPAGLDHDGFAVKAFGGGGTYQYVSGALGDAAVAGRQFMGALMPGWRFKRDGFELGVFAGLDLQDHQVVPFDPGARVYGTHAGLRTGLDLWYEPMPGMMLAGNASISSIGPGYWMRVATGWRVLDRVWLGPEALGLGDPSYRQWRLGVHATAFTTGRFEWSAGTGWAGDSDQRTGLYLRLGLLTRR